MTPTLIGQRGRVLVVVRDEQGGQAELVQELLQLAAHGHLRMGIERRERLVEEEDARVAGERPREGDALALAARELGRARLREVRDLEALEVLVDPVPAAVGDVLAHRHVREEGVLLEDEADAALVGLQEDVRLGVEPDVVVEHDPPARRTDETGDGPQHRRLAGARGADERDRPLDLEREL